VALYLLARNESFHEISVCVIFNFLIVVHYSVYKHNINHKMTSFNRLYGDMFRLYAVAILRPTWNNVQVHKVRTQWDTIPFTSISYTVIKYDTIS